MFLPDPRRQHYASAALAEGPGDPRTAETKEGRGETPVPELPGIFTPGIIAAFLLSGAGSDIR